MYQMYSLYLSLALCVCEHQSSACHFYRLPLPSFLYDDFFFGFSSLTVDVDTKQPSENLYTPSFLRAHTYSFS